MKMMNNKVSVLLPAYNSEKTIGATIDSILHQTFTDYELIIINDGSTDNTENVITNYHDNRIQYYKNECNIGLIATLNRGLKLCSGKYIVRIDADDIMLPSRIEKQVKYMDENPSLVASGSSVIKFNENGFKKIYTPPLTSYAISYGILLGSPIPHPASIIRRDTLLKNKIEYKEKYVCAEDYRFWYDLSKCGNLANIEEPLLMYRISESQISTRQNVKQVKMSIVIRTEIVLDILKTYNIKLPKQLKISSVKNIAEKMSDTEVNSTIILLLLLSLSSYSILSLFQFLFSSLWIRKGFRLKYIYLIIARFLKMKRANLFLLNLEESATQM